MTDSKKRADLALIQIQALLRQPRTRAEITSLQAAERSLRAFTNANVPPAGFYTQITCDKLLDFRTQLWQLQAAYERTLQNHSPKALVLLRQVAEQVTEAINTQAASRGEQ